MYDGNSVYSRIETGFAFKPNMDDVYVKSFNGQTFNRDVGEPAKLKTKTYNPPDLTVQHLPVKETVKKIEVIGMGNEYNMDTLTSVDIQKIVKIGEKVIQNYESVVYREDFKILTSRKVTEKLFALKQEFKGER